jgi:hypothetical protein
MAGGVSWRDGSYGRVQARGWRRASLHEMFAEGRVAWTASVRALDAAQVLKARPRRGDCRQTNWRNGTVIR